MVSIRIAKMGVSAGKDLSGARAGECRLTVFIYRSRSLFTFFSLHILSSFLPFDLFVVYSVSEMYFHAGLAAAFAAAGAFVTPVLADTINSTSPCGIITEQINEFYSDEASKDSNHRCVYLLNSSRYTQKLCIAAVCCVRMPPIVGNRQ